MGLIYSIDGNKVMAHSNNFKNLAVSNAGFGDSLKEAFFDFYKNSREIPSLKDVHPWEFEWAQEYINLIKR